MPALRQRLPQFVLFALGQTTQAAALGGPNHLARRYADGAVSLADLAEEYSVGRSTIHCIIHRPEPDSTAQQA
jgi:hypothetical protein